MDFTGALRLLKNITDEVDSALGQSRDQAALVDNDYESTNTNHSDQQQQKDIAAEAILMDKERSNHNGLQDETNTSVSEDLQRLEPNGLQQQFDEVSHSQLNDETDVQSKNGKADVESTSIDAVSDVSIISNVDISLNDCNDNRESNELRDVTEKSNDDTIYQKRECDSDIPERNGVHKETEIVNSDNDSIIRSALSEKSSSCTMEIDSRIESNKNTSSANTIDSGKVQMSEFLQMRNLNSILNKKLESLSSRLAESDEALEAKKQLQSKIEAAERKIYALTKERDVLKRQNDGVGSTNSLLKEKDNMIKQVMEEGEALSKKQAENEQVIKKLRQKLKHVEGERERLNQSLSIEESRLKEISNESANFKADAAALVERHKSDLLSQEKKYEALLEKARKDLIHEESRVDAEIAQRSSAAQVEIAAREEAMHETLNALRASLTMQEEQAALREELLRKSIDDQKLQLLESEKRNEELSTRLPNATRPLMRQIEAMHRQMEENSESWNATEKSLMRRVTDAQALSAAAVERERAILDEKVELVASVAAAETQRDTLKTEVHRLQNESQRICRELKMSKENLVTLQKKEQTITESAAGQCKELKSQIQILTKDLQNQRDNVTFLEERLKQANERNHELEQDLQNWKTVDHISDKSRIDKNARKGELTGVSLLNHMDNNDNLLEINGTNVLTLPSQNMSTPLGNLESELRRREGELTIAKEQITALELTRSRLADELLQSSTGEEKLRLMTESYEDLERQYIDLQMRHASALVS